MRTVAIAAAACVAISFAIFGALHLNSGRVAIAPNHLTVTADERNIYGAPWDGVEGGIGVPGLPGFGMLSTASPPDMALCVVDLKGASCQYTEDAKGRPQSLFHDRYEATFPVKLRTDTPVGIIIYDIDGTMPFGMDPNDLIDAVIFAKPGTDTSRIDQSIRDLIEQVAPSQWVFRAGKPGEKRFSLSDNERRRREGPIPVFSLDDCAKTACRLQQSRISLQ